MKKNNTIQSAPKTELEKEENSSRRGFLSKLFLAIGGILGYGLFAGEGLLFVIPGKRKIPTVKIYAGRLKQFVKGAVKNFYTPDGTKIMIRRDENELRAFSAICPHLGCLVHWQPENNEFFCPCHGGVFTADGVAIKGPPADAGQSLSRIPLAVDEVSQIVYIEVKKPKRATG